MQYGTSSRQQLALAHQELQIVLDSANTSDERGRALERAAGAFFSAVPGCEVHGRRVLDPFRSSEIDLLVGNRRRDAGLYYLPEMIPVECKSSEKPVTAAEIRDFASKVQDRNLQLGVLVTRAGVTGARSQAESAYHTAALTAARGIKMLLVTVPELRSVTTAHAFVELLHGKVFRLTASGTFDARL
jgi:hypothetical protein